MRKLLMLAGALACFEVAFSIPLVNATPQAASSTPAPGIATGQKIGNIIKTAISTVAPGISQIADIFWKGRTNPGTDNTKKTEAQQQADLNAGAKKPEVQKQVQDQFVVAAQQKIQPVGEVAAELGVLNLFLEPSVNASQYVIVIRTQLKQSPIPWPSIKTNFDLVKGQLQKVKGVQDNDLNKIRDLYLRDRLKHIKDANDAPTTLVDSDITAQDKDSLAIDIVGLSTTLGDMTAMAGYELADLQGDITELANWAKGTGGTDVPRKQDKFKAFLDKNVP